MVPMDGWNHDDWITECQPIKVAGLRNADMGEDRSQGHKIPGRVEKGLVGHRI